MSNNTKENKDCQLHKFEKNKYFYGKLMTVRDFETEQSYFDEKRHLINRLLNGSGLICGFEQIQIKTAADGNLNMLFIDGGAALDCCGREIVVPPNTEEKILNSSGSSVSNLTGTPYLYLKYKACYDGYVASASNPSSCAEKCCPGKTVESFEVIASDKAPELKELECRLEFTPLKDVTVWLEDLEKDHRICPSCADKERVFLATVKDENGIYSVDSEDTAKNRIFFTQKELYQLFKCHILDINNPHAVTAVQTGALVSVDGVGNAGGDVDLVPEGSIVITPDDTNDRITIGENHSAKKDNPHQVTAIQTGALVSIDGVSNPGGNVDLIAGSNVSITPNPSTHTIEIASTGGGGEPATTVQSVGTSLIVGTSDRYSREDHVHNLGRGVVDIENLSEKLQKQLELLFMYLRERALKCTVSNFKAIGIQFNNDIAFKIAQNTKDAVNNKVYQKEEDFMEFMKELLELMMAFADNIQGRSTDESFRNFLNALEELKEALGSEDALRVAIQQDEVCFYVSELEIRG
ncbi:hypothetical protein Metho_1611 [Methanomethylovorans hollandica DSM 15978]|uniref:Uncharacterized protein n=1 Tax=Methanomethylovorans hollandica (strain DSM 15978 / NBRC 107637 / DMS1) TaxID=867904 RepID=L0KYR4_METHD|nr:hypothetical protein [Methanomethylovorans hollandica]AGB49805.1 hypothetical protein Metho_1611 [Methanomethylovorans hollandica DSM 15978]